MELNITGRDGALTKYEIIGDSAAAAALVASITTYMTTETENGIRGRASKSDIAKIRVAVEAAKIQPDEVVVSTSNASRTLMLSAVAKRDGLHHGKSWICGEREIETMGACPSWDGMQVCYVYAN
jgi:hypothetical protein